MTQQVFTVGQEVIRVAPSNGYIHQGEVCEVSYVSPSGNWIDLVGHDISFESSEFRPASNIKPIPDTEESTMNDNEIDLTPFSHQAAIGKLETEINELRNSIVSLETELGETKEQHATMNQWWYEEKTKGEALKELVVKQATQMMA
jgi:hypothetical protein